MSRARAISVLAAIGVPLGSACCAGLWPALAFLAPALLLFGMLLTRRYPGSRHVARLAARSRPRRRPRLGFRPAAPARRDAARACGGLLVAAALAKRGPPVSAPAR